ncbi:MAG: hypothetical protein K2N89_10820 [Lachnospiraceae bacterium]|nr:hypothetical protein [Lachnospiraceae bacterium]
MYAQAAIKPNTLLCNGAYGIDMRGVQNALVGTLLRGRNSVLLCCIKLDTATDAACGSGAFFVKSMCNMIKEAGILILKKLSKLKQSNYMV